MLLQGLDVVSLGAGRLLDIVTTLLVTIMIQKSSLGATPAYISSLFQSKNDSNGLRGINKLQIPRVIILKLF